LWHLRDHNALRRAQINVAAYAQFRINADFFSLRLFCLGGVTETGQTFARHFGPPPDIMEDPFTGLATGGMAACLWRYGLLESAHLHRRTKIRSICSICVP
jgi:trans-2,3-dihydro-3-hydroxyanthranilate isomerase